MLGRALLDGLFPLTCQLCQQVVERNIALCRHCERALQRNIDACACCALPLPRAARCEHLCIACQEASFDFDRVLAPFVYDAALARLIGRWKYARDQRLTALLAELWLSRATAFAVPDVLVPVPLHWRRQLWRGFNQAELLARYLARRHPELRAEQVHPRLLRRRRAARAQASLGAGGRSDNASGAFTLAESCDNLHVALVDDVCTTGATADAASRLLRAGGARVVDVWCLARTPPPFAGIVTLSTLQVPACPATPTTH